MEGSWPAVAGLLVGVASIVLTYVFFRLGQQQAIARYVIAGSTVVRSAERIEVRYDGAVVPQVSRTLVTFWNGGNVPIRREDVREQLTISLTEGQVLEAQVLAATRAEIRPSVSRQGPQAVALDFSHLDPDDGAVIEVFHTGEDAFAVDVNAVIIGVPEGPVRIRTPLWDDPAGPWIGGVVLAIALGSIVYTGLEREWGAMGIFIVLGLLLGWYVGIQNRRRDVRWLPEGLRDVDYPSVPWSEWAD